MANFQANTHTRTHALLDFTISKELHIPWALLSDYISGEVNAGVSQPLIGQLSPYISVIMQPGFLCFFVKLAADK